MANRKLHIGRRHGKKKAGSKGIEEIVQAGDSVPEAAPVTAPRHQAAKPMKYVHFLPEAAYQQLWDSLVRERAECLLRMREIDGLLSSLESAASATAEHVRAEEEATKKKQDEG